MEFQSPKLDEVKTKIMARLNRRVIAAACRVPVWIFSTRTQEESLVDKMLKEGGK